MRCLFQTKVGADFLIFKDVDNPAQHSAKGRKSSFKNYEICISAMTPVALFHLLFGTENDRSKRPIINCASIIFLPLLLTGKVAENQNQFLKSRFKFRNLEDLSKDLKSFYASSPLFERVFVYIFGLITLL